jgi:hypothetical protein
LIAAKGKVVAKDDIRLRIWAGQQTGDVQGRLESLIRRVKAKFSKIGAPNPIVTEHGVGYSIKVHTSVSDRFPDDPIFPIGINEEALSEEIPVQDFLRRLAPAARPPILERRSHILVDALSYVELSEGGYETILANLREQVRITYLVGSDRLRSLTELVRFLCRPGLIQCAERNAEPNSGLDNGDLRCVREQVRIVVVPLQISAQNIYIVNVRTEANARLYHVDLLRGVASCRMIRKNAIEEAELRYKYAQQPTNDFIEVTSYLASGNRVRAEIRDAIVADIEPELHPYLHGITPYPTPAAIAFASR